MKWLVEKVEWLTRRWAEGASAGVIGAEMGVSRNAILGKRDRLGLPSRMTLDQQPKPPRPPRPPRPRRPSRNVVAGLLYQKAFKPKPLPKPAPAVHADPAAYRCTLMELTEYTCRYPLGNAMEPATHYCGHPSADLANKVSYCRHHHLVTHMRYAR